MQSGTLLCCRRRKQTATLNNKNWSKVNSAVSFLHFFWIERCTMQLLNIPTLLVIMSYVRVFILGDVQKNTQYCITLDPDWSNQHVGRHFNNNLHTATCRGTQQPSSSTVSIICLYAFKWSCLDRIGRWWRKREQPETAYLPP